MESYGDSWGFADEDCRLVQNKVLMKFADIHTEIFSLFASCDDKIGITENHNQTCSSSNWTCLE